MLTYFIHYCHTMVFVSKGTFGKLIDTHQLNGRQPRKPFPYFRVAERVIAE
jgi:hypothetical protein